MMHHPIHLHGHFFRVVNGQGGRSPLKHTVDVPPMGRRLIEFEANERHDWMFHCHILYHMMSGMGRIFRYEAEPGVTDQHLGAVDERHHGGLGEHAHEMWFAWGEASLLSNLSDGLLTVRNGRNDLLLEWEIGWENVPNTEYEADFHYQRYVSPDFQVFAGLRLTHEETTDTRAVAGFNYRLPLRLHSSVSLDSEGDARFALAHSLALTSRLSAFGRVEYDTGTEWEWTAGASYTLTKAISLTTQVHSEYGFGAGLSLRF
jgi:hypothetical protein